MLISLTGCILVFEQEIRMWTTDYIAVEEKTADEQLAPSGDAREGAGEGGARGVVDDDEVEGLVPGQHLPDDEGGHGPGR